MLNRKFGPESKPDIKSLSLESMEKREEKWFDVDKEISDEERSIIRGILNTLGNSHDGVMRWDEEYLKLAYFSRYIGITLPELTTRKQKQLVEHIKERNRSLAWHSLIHDAGHMKAAFGFHKLADVGLNPTYLEGMIVFSDNRRKDRDWLDFISLRISMGILFPEKLSELRPNGTELREGKEKAWEIIEAHRNGKGGLINLVVAYRLLADIRLFNPDADLGINEKAQEEMRRYFELTRKELKEHPDNVIQCQYFAEMAMIMTILSADRPELTQKGIEIKDRRQEITANTPALPNQRNF